MADKKSSNKLYKQISAVVLAVFQGQYLRRITMQPIRQLQWTDIKATSEILIISFLENNKVQYRLNKKTYSLLVYNFCMAANIFKVAASLSIFSKTQTSLAQQRRKSEK